MCCCSKSSQFSCSCLGCSEYFIFFIYLTRLTELRVSGKCCKWLAVLSALHVCVTAAAAAAQLMAVIWLTTPSQRRVCLVPSQVCCWNTCAAAAGAGRWSVCLHIKEITEGPWGPQTAIVLSGQVQLFKIWSICSLVTVEKLIWLKWNSWRTHAIFHDLNPAGKVVPSGDLFTLNLDSLILTGIT